MILALSLRLRRPAPRRVLAALLMLAACGAAEPPVPAAQALVSRAVGAPIASSLRGTAPDLNGDWIVASAILAVR
ncbi:hypothetical protein [Limimaricola cinnabarinus]|uniref:Uncharacterized protein n=1 Tax=Limimaricola cinnabarinus LL-001 TaxID=1337093 RepID=U2YHT1_9RHOB|nr:hypothetical protein [Limimaricola cinnabarinus]GAD54141.1 hypothetical protein MBELCI_0193 [Limimaricola cinnabarinus LL-001]